MSETRIDSIGIFDEEEIHTDCTVQILRNSVTGEYSVGWTENRRGCAWCGRESEWTVIDDDFGQPVHPDLVRYCFHCGRKLKEAVND